MKITVASFILYVMAEAQDRIKNFNKIKVPKPIRPIHPRPYRHGRPGNLVNKYKWLKNKIASPR